MSMWKRREPEITEAFQWTGGPDQTEDPEWIVDAIREGHVVIRYPEMRLTSVMDNWVYAKPGDWVIKATSKHRFTVLDDVTFHERFEPV